MTEIDLRWGTRRAVCEQLIELLDVDWCINPRQNRGTILEVLTRHADLGCESALLRVLQDPRESPWNQRRVVQSFSRLGLKLAQETLRPLIQEWLRQLRPRHPGTMGGRALVELLDLSPEPQAFSQLFLSQDLQRKRHLLRSGCLPETLASRLIPDWLAQADPTNLEDQDLGWILVADPSARSWLFVHDIPVDPRRLRELLREKTPAQVNAIFQQAPHARRRAEADFCLPLSSLSLPAEQVLEQIRLCIAAEARRKRPSPRAQGARFLLRQMGPEALSQARDWTPVSSSFSRALSQLEGPGPRGQYRALLDAIWAPQPEMEEVFLAALHAQHPGERYLALRGLERFSGANEATLLRLSHQDPHPLVRILALGILVGRGGPGQAELLKLAQTSQSVLERAEALRSLALLGGHQALLFKALEDRELEDQFYTPVADEAATGLALLPEDAGMQTLLRASLRGHCSETQLLLHALIERGLDGESLELPVLFAWRRRALGLTPHRTPSMASAPP